MFVGNEHTSLSRDLDQRRGRIGHCTVVFVVVALAVGSHRREEESGE